MTVKKQYIHFSFDDVYECLDNLIVHAGIYSSIFQNPFFSWLRSMHDTYGAVFSLYTFNHFSENPKYDISKLSSHYAKEFIDNADWLKFGFHAKDDLKKYKVDEPEVIKADYEKFLHAIMHATNYNESSIDRVIRLGFCAGTQKNVSALQYAKCGILGLLAADDDRMLYHFGKEETTTLIEKGEFFSEGLLYLRSQTRMEYVNCIDDVLESIKSYTKPKVIELFTHEMQWNRESKVQRYSILQLCEYFIKWAYENGYGFGFAQDVYGNYR